MALESAKCPNCAAEIQVPNDREDTFCAYCGSKIKTRAAIGYFQVELKGKVQIDNAPKVKALIIRGKETGNSKYFDEALDIDPTNAEARRELILHNASSFLAGDEDHNLYRRITPLFVDRSKGFIYNTLFGDTTPKKFEKIIKNHPDIKWLPEDVFGDDFWRLDRADRKIIINKAAIRIKKAHDHYGLIGFSQYDDYDALFRYMIVLNNHGLYVGQVSDAIRYCAIKLDADKYRRDMENILNAKKPNPDYFSFCKREYDIFVREIINLS